MGFGEVDMSFETCKPVTLYCPNCGHKIIGFKDSEGILRVSCDRCKCVIVSKHHSRKTTMKVVAP